MQSTVPMSLAASFSARGHHCILQMNSVRLSHCSLFLHTVFCAIDLIDKHQAGWQPGGSVGEAKSHIRSDIVSAQIANWLFVCAARFYGKGQRCDKCSALGGHKFYGFGTCTSAQARYPIGQTVTCAFHTK